MNDPVQKPPLLRNGFKIAGSYALIFILMALTNGEQKFLSPLVALLAVITVVFIWYGLKGAADRAENPAHISKGTMRAFYIGKFLTIIYFLLLFSFTLVLGAMSQSGLYLLIVALPPFVALIAAFKLKPTGRAAGSILIIACLIMIVELIAAFIFDGAQFANYVYIIYYYSPTALIAVYFSVLFYLVIPKKEGN